MQLVGQHCEKCNARIASIAQGVACVSCEQAWHVDCLGPSADGDQSDQGDQSTGPAAHPCPSCGADFRETRDRAAAADEQETNERVAQGRRIFLLGAIPILALGALAAWSRLSDTGSPVGFGRLLLSAGLLWMVWRGHPWARKLITILLCIGAGLALLGAVAAEDPALRLILVGTGGVNAAFAGALMLSDPLRTFLVRQGRVNEIDVRER